MQFPRVFSVLSFFFAYTLLFVAASPIESDKAVVAKRSTESEVIAILTPLHTNAVAKAVEIKTLASAGNPDEATVTSLFNDLTDMINGATSQLSQVAPSTKRQSDDAVATLVATIMTDIVTTLDGVATQLAGIPTIGTLFSGLDAALNQLLKGLEGLLAGVLNLVATLLVNVAALLRNLALGLTLASLGL